MVKVTRETGGSYYCVAADTAEELLPLLPLLQEVHATRYDSGTAWRVHRLDRQRVETAVADAQTLASRAPLARPVAIRDQAPADLYHAPREAQALRGRGLCVECGSPTSAPHHLYCRECR